MIRRICSVGFILAVGSTAACSSSEAPASVGQTPGAGGTDPQRAGAAGQAGQGAGGLELGGAGAGGSATGGAGASGGMNAAGATGKAGEGGDSGGARSGGSAGTESGGMNAASGGNAGEGGSAGVSGAGGASAGSSGTNAMGGTGNGGAGAAGAPGCERGRIEANEVLWIGDSWIQIPGNQHSGVRDFARQAGALGQNDDYVNRAVSGSTIATIVNQYNTQQSGSTKVKVLLMDGGGIDVMQGAKSQTTVDNVVSTFEAHLAKVESDGTVEHIIYYLYPQLPSAGPGRDVGPLLQPGMQAACEASTVPCHFLYLEPLFAGHPEYIGGDNLHASEAGGEVIAEAVWEIMLENCIAQ